TQAVAGYHARIDELLLAALAIAAAWRNRRRGEPGEPLFVDIENHGREEIFSGTDVSQTIGWFTAAHPVLLPACDPADDRPEVALKAIKRTLRGIPDRGIGFGLLRYLNPETATRLADYERADLGFNYLGQFSGPAQGEDRQGSELARVVDERMPLIHPVSLNAWTVDRDGGPQLHADWTWTPSLFDEEEVRTLANDWFKAIGLLVERVRDPAMGSLIPQDLPLVNLSQEQ